jgi:hypothetical protein
MDRWRRQHSTLSCPPTATIAALLAAAPLATAEPPRGHEAAANPFHDADALIGELLGAAAPPPALKLDENGVPEGWVVIHGDIIMPPLPVGAATYDIDLWTNNVVPYAFDANVDETNRQRALDAMAEWEAVANVEFTPWLGEANWVRIRDSTVNSSSVGMIGGQQIINISDWTWKFIIAHELGHTLGYWHEQSRLDRDAYVQINWENIPDDDEDNFEWAIGSRHFGPYDYDSVMHYDQCSFSSCGSCGDSTPECWTITTLDPAFQDDIGQRSHLSHWDATVMSYMYAEPDWRFVNEGFTGTSDGTFLGPWKTFVAGQNDVPAGGRLHIVEGTYAAIGTWTKPMTIKAPFGDAVLATD